MLNLNHFAISSKGGLHNAIFNCFLEVAYPQEMPQSISVVCAMGELHDCAPKKASLVHHHEPIQYITPTTTTPFPTPMSSPG